MAWAPDYTDLATLKSALRIGDTVDDVELAAAITAASRAIDHATNRQFGVVDAAEERIYTDIRYRPARTPAPWVVDIDDLSSTTGLVVTVNGAAVDAANYVLLPLNAAAVGEPWRKLALSSVTAGNVASGGLCSVSVTGLWGWAAIPDPIPEACKIQATRFFKRRESPLGIAGSPELGSEMRLLAKVDPDVELMVRTRRRKPVWT